MTLNRPYFLLFLLMSFRICTSQCRMSVRLSNWRQPTMMKSRMILLFDVTVDKDPTAGEGGRWSDQQKTYKLDWWYFHFHENKHQCQQWGFHIYTSSSAEVPLAPTSTAIVINYHPASIIHQRTERWWWWRQDDIRDCCKQPFMMPFVQNRPTHIDTVLMEFSSEL